MKTIGVIGGDLRQLSLAKEFTNDGYDVYTYGLARLGVEDDSRAFCADIIVLPLPLTSGENLNMPFSDDKLKLLDVVDIIPCNTIVFGGKFSSIIESRFKEKNITCFDVLSRPEFPVYNAVPTAEGAVEIAIAETPYTIYGSKILLTGYGNISKVMAKILFAMGADVDLAIRNKKQSAEAECLGFKTYHTNEIINHIHKYDIIFNTVPTLLFNAKILSKTKSDLLLIDLASKPGGVDFDAAKDMSKRVIWALSLPGKTAPVSAGLIIKKTIVNILKEMEECDNAEG